MRALVMPGMNGSGDLFSECADALPPEFKATVLDDSSVPEAD